MVSICSGNKTVAMILKLSNFSNKQEHGNICSNETYNSLIVWYFSKKTLNALNYNVKFNMKNWKWINDRNNYIVLVKFVNFIIN